MASLARALTSSPRLFRLLPGMPLVAEYGGFITPDVRELMAEFGIPGMRVLLFGFDGDPGLESGPPGKCP